MIDFNRLKEFGRCTTVKQELDSYVVSCNLGLWSVQGPYLFTLITEALRYWECYLDDGEYSDILGGPSVLDKLMEE